MKRVFLSFIMVVVLSMAAAPAFAGGDKVRGEKGNGEVNQVNFNDQGNQN